VARNRKRAKERRTRRPPGAVVRPSIGAARSEGVPTPIEHAAPDVELADAQLAVGRPEFVDGAGEEPDPEFEDEELEEEDAPVATLPGPVAPRAPINIRLIGFLQGSWRELQRVQWPDRRQVVQATSVVIGFVIVAGAFLGVADFVAQKIMKFILG
jgi:preprotein translocase subunit SecE